jgi:hypothetical protein
MSHGHRSRIVAAVVVPVAMLVALLAWAVSSPPGSSPDDDYHMASIWCAGGLADGRCEAAADDTQRQLPAELLEAAGCFAFNADQAADCPRHENQMRTTERGNWSTHAYPPLFYAVMSVFVGDDLSTSIVLMRAFNAVLYVGLLTALFFLLPRPQRTPFVWGAAISVVPLGMFLIASVNPSGWAILSATGLWVAAWGYFRQTGTRKWLLAAMAVVFLIIGAGSRSDAAVYGVLALMVAVVLAFRRDRSFALQSLLPLGLTVVAVAFFLGAGQSSVVAADTVAENRPYSVWTLTFLNAKLLPQLWAGVFGYWGLGWLDTALPGVVWVTTMTIFGALVFWGLRVGALRKWISLALVALALIAVPMYILVHDGVVVGSAVQPRYIYPLIIMFGGVALVGMSQAGLGLGRLQLGIVAVGLVLANAVSLHVNMRRYITGVDDAGVNLDRAIEWWWNAPVSPMTIWLFGVLAFAAAVAVLAWTAWERPGARVEHAATAAAPQSSFSPVA